MLEHMSFYLQPWNRATADAPWQRRITDIRARPLGFVRCIFPVRGAWFAWLRRTRLEVYETEDASHLMTLVRAWSIGPTWVTYDADALFLGTVHPRSIIASDGIRVGEFQPTAGGGRIVDPAGIELMTYSTADDGTVEIRFTKQAMANPFLRMLLLSCVLMLNVPS